MSNNIENITIKGDTEIDIQMLSVDEVSSSQDSSVSRYTSVSSRTNTSNYVDEVIPSYKDITKYPFPVRQDSSPLTNVLDIDLKTKDNHVPRDQELLRLTGSHPFNCEPPLSTLYNSGFLTPAQLHFVRNHGPVPQVLDQDILNWEISIEGMVAEPYKIKLSEIISEFEIFTVPITLVCAGNRRKEQNMVKKGTGFNWGAAGTSTNLWTGPLLMDIIERAKPFKKARHVWMEGCDDPANGAYGTSIMLHYIRDHERSIMLAYKQNGEFLTPDHGRPLRVIIPGVIGGRSVKWLKRLVVSDVPSDNWYHYYDNKVLPTMVDPEEAKANDHWWKDERYTLYDLNIQSITCKPEHDEILDLSNYSNIEKDEYTLGGFAYNGGGIRVGRVEISLDKGKTWRLAEIDYPEDRYREAGYFRLFGGLVNVCDRMSCLCWCFWKLQVKVSDLIKSKDILVRAMDNRMVVQPRNMYWNVTSMLNNWWYRVAIVKLDDGKYTFQHPVHATKAGGWMDRVKAEGGDILDNNWGEYDEDLANGTQKPRELKPVIDEDLEMMCNPEKMNVIITKEELAKHENNEENPWFVVKGHVFDGTDYLEDHPGGAQSITMVSGEDATEDFMAIHSSFAKKMLPKWHLGKLEVQNDKNSSSLVVEEEEDFSSRPTLLDPKKWHKIKLFEKEVISHDTRIFKFELQHPDQTTGLAVGKHLFIRLMDKSTNKYVMRAYTPKSCHRTKGRLEILIKIYFPEGDFKGGAMTTLIEDLPIGEYIETKGPIGEFEYLGYGECLVNGKSKFKVDKFVMIAGGSGITPCYQVLKEVLRPETSPKDPTQLDFFFGNKTIEDILCKQELDELAKINDNFKLDYSLSDKSRLPSDWDGFVGRLSFKLIDDYMNGYMDNGKAMLLVCGPPGMNKVVEDWVVERNFNKEYVIYF